MAMSLQLFFGQSDVFHIDDLARDADTKLFRQASDDRHCLHPLLPKQRPPKLMFSLRSRRHSYTLPHRIFTIQKLLCKQMFVCYDLITVCVFLRIVVRLYVQCESKKIPP